MAQKPRDEKVLTDAMARKPDGHTWFSPRPKTLRLGLIIRKRWDMFFQQAWDSPTDQVTCYNSPVQSREAWLSSYRNLRDLAWLNYKNEVVDVPMSLDMGTLKRGLARTIFLGITCLYP